MNVNQLIIDTLAPLGIPVQNMKYSGSSTTYITFFCFNEQGEAWAENEEIATDYAMQVDVWSKGDFTDVVNQAKGLLKIAGFKRTFAHEFYEVDTQIYHKVLRFSYVS